MSLREIDDVDVIADGSAVFGGVVVAEDGEIGTTADGDLCEKGEEVVRDAQGVFTQSARGVGAGWVEVA